MAPDVPESRNEQRRSEGGLLELRRAAGSQFDPVLVDAVWQHLLSETAPIA
jgi:hypothetical protein